MKTKINKQLQIVINIKRLTTQLSFVIGALINFSISLPPYSLALSHSPENNLYLLKQTKNVSSGTLNNIIIKI